MRNDTLYFLADKSVRPCLSKGERAETEILLATNVANT